MITIETEKAIIWGENGLASYVINDSGGLELTGMVDGGLTDAELDEAVKELELT